MNVTRNVEGGMVTKFSSAQSLYLVEHVLQHVVLSTQRENAKSQADIWTILTQLV